MKYILQDEDTGNYYAGQTGIGPRFTVDKEEAKHFDTHKEAATAIGTHWAMGGCVVREVPE